MSNKENNILTIQTVQIAPFRTLMTALKDILLETNITFQSNGIKIVKNMKSDDYAKMLRSLDGAGGDGPPAADSGVAGTDNTGGGGGGGGNNTSVGSNGGSGIVVIRYQI